MISINDKTLCCGCGGCAQICPQNCIEMDRDSEGFLYPRTGDRCTDCGLCNQVCPIVNVPTTEGEYPSAYGMVHKNNEIRQKSSSGGAFSLFAEWVIDNGGIVFGCAMDEELQPKHIGVEEVKDLDRLRGAKYIQSDIGDTYQNVKKAITAGRKALFVGTPCQAAGLFWYMKGTVCDNLYIVDFICHGVPSNKVFWDFIGKEEKANAEKIVSHKFRKKDHGWSQSGLQLGTESIFDSGVVKRRYPAFADKFMNGFLSDIYLRPSCYHCKFKNVPKEYADITIADFWGVKKVASNLDDGKGTSLVLVNTEKGSQLWNMVKDGSRYKQVDYEMAIKRNQSLVASAVERLERVDFFNDYNTEGYFYVERKYMSAWAWVWYRFKKALKYAKKHEDGKR